MRVSMVLEGCPKGDSMLFQKCFWDFSEGFQGSLKMFQFGVKGVLIVCFKNDSPAFLIPAIYGT